MIRGGSFKLQRFMFCWAALPSSFPSFVIIFLDQWFFFVIYGMVLPTTVQHRALLQSQLLGGACCLVSLIGWKGSQKLDVGQTIHSHHVGWRNLVQVSLIFVIIVSFMLFTVFTLVYVLYFEEFLIHDSRGFMILKNN